MYATYASYRGRVRLLCGGDKTARVKRFYVLRRFPARHVLLSRTIRVDCATGVRARAPAEFAACTRISVMSEVAVAGGGVRSARLDTVRATNCEWQQAARDVTTAVAVAALTVVGMGVRAAGHRLGRTRIGRRPREISTRRRRTRAARAGVVCGGGERSGDVYTDIKTIFNNASGRRRERSPRVYSAARPFGRTE